MSSVSGGGSSTYGGLPASVSKVDLTPSTVTLDYVDAVAYSVRTTPGGGVEAAFIDQVSVSGEGVLTFAGFNGADSGSDLSVELVVDGINILPALLVNGVPGSSRVCVMVGLNSMPGPIPFAAGFVMRTKETTKTTAIDIKCYYQYRLTS